MIWLDNSTIFSQMTWLSTFEIQFHQTLPLCVIHHTYDKREHSSSSISCSLSNSYFCTKASSSISQFCQLATQISTLYYQISLLDYPPM